MQGKNTKECGIKIHTYIYLLLSPPCPGGDRPCWQPRPGIAPHRTTPKRGTVAQAEKLQEKWGLKAADFSPSGVRRRWASRGLGGPRLEQCPAEPPRAVLSPAALSRDSRVTPPVPPETSGLGPGREAPLVPRVRWKRRMLFFSVKLSY